MWKLGGNLAEEFEVGVFRVRLNARFLRQATMNVMLNICQFSQLHKMVRLVNCLAESRN